MPPKRNTRRGSSSSESLKGSDKSTDLTESGLAHFSHKPCLCCGREISPRAKWARNWDSIKFCSDQCKSWRSTLSLHEQVVPQHCNQTILTNCLEVAPASRSVRLHLDAWLEASILLTAKEKRPSNKKEPLPTLQDASNALTSDIEALRKDEMDFADKEQQSTGSGNAHSRLSEVVEAILRGKPGEREMLRRAARRLVVLARTSLQSSEWLEREDRPNSLALPSAFRLTQNHGKTHLQTLHDVSHAKGDIEIQADQDS